MPKDPERQRLPRKAKGKNIKKQPKRDTETDSDSEQDNIEPIVDLRIEDEEPNSFKLPENWLLDPLNLETKVIVESRTSSPDFTGFRPLLIENNLSNTSQIKTNTNMELASLDEIKTRLANIKASLPDELVEYDKSLKELDAALDKYAVDGNVDPILNIWRETVTKKFEVLQAHIEELDSVPEDTISADQGTKDALNRLSNALNNRSEKHDKAK